MASRSTDRKPGREQQVYDVVIEITLENTDREVADEFSMALQIRELDLASIEVILSVVAPNQCAAYARGNALARAVLDAAGLVDAYRIGDVYLIEVR